jgi:hypothetical protein
VTKSMYEVAMPWSHDPNVQALRLKYNAAFAAHQASARGLSQAGVGGTVPSSAAVDSEARARVGLVSARAALFAAMAAIVAPPIVDVSNA